MTTTWVFFPSTTAGGTPWTPANLATAPLAWWNASEGVTHSSNIVSAWADQSGSNDLAQSTEARKPALEAASLNSLDVINFTDDRMYLSSDLTGIRSAIFVCEARGSSDNSQVCPVFGNNAGNEHTFVRTNSTDYSISIDGSSSTNGHANWNGNSLVAGTNIDLSLTEAQIESWSVWYTDYDTSVEMKYLGTLGSAENYWTRNTYAEVLLFDYVPSTSDRQKLEGYLAHRYALTADMPSGHPYKSSAPTT